MNKLQAVQQEQIEESPEKNKGLGKLKKVLRAVGAIAAGAVLVTALSACDEKNDASEARQHLTTFGEAVHKQVSTAAKSGSGSLKWDAYKITRKNWDTLRYPSDYTSIKKTTVEKMLSSGEDATPKDSAANECFNALIQENTKRHNKTILVPDVIEGLPGVVLKYGLESYSKGNYSRASAACGAVGTAYIQDPTSRGKDSSIISLCGNPCLNDNTIIVYANGVKQ